MGRGRKSNTLIEISHLYLFRLLYLCVRKVAAVVTFISDNRGCRRVNTQGSHEHASNYSELDYIAQILAI